MCIEKEVERPLQWIVCFLHMLELPGRALFWKLDGGTSGPVCTLKMNLGQTFGRTLAEPSVELLATFGRTFDQTFDQTFG